jgi:hypothetical protein
MGWAAVEWAGRYNGRVTSSGMLFIRSLMEIHLLVPQLWGGGTASGND